MELEWSGEGLRFRAKGQNGAITQIGRDGDITGPMELLLEAVAGCFSIDAIGILEKQRVGLRSYRVKASSERVEDGHARPYRSIQLVVEITADKALSEEQKRRLAELGLEYCSVSKSLKADVTVEIQSHIA